ncbi:MAG: GNAT family N-acetyltransferase [Parvularculales bacterium]
MAEIRTDRLVLKKLGHADKERLVNLIGDFRVSKNLSSVPYPYTLDDADKWLEIVNNDKFSLNIFLNNNLVGGIGLTPRDNGFYELGYWLGVDYWGQGYATEAVRGFLDYLKTNTTFRKLKACVLSENIASAKLLKKIGFLQVGEEECFSLAQQEKLPSLNYEYYLEEN